jgi:hypothetical protein
MPLIKNVSPKTTPRDLKRQEVNSMKNDEVIRLSRRCGLQPLLVLKEHSSIFYQKFSQSANKMQGSRIELAA